MRLAVSVMLTSLVSMSALAADSSQTIPAGMAAIDITPDHPIRLAGYAARTQESEPGAARIWAKALALGGDESPGPAVLVMFESCGMPREFRDELAARLATKYQVRSERFVLGVTHAHSAPWLPGYGPCLSLTPLPAEHEAHRERYARALMGKLEEVVSQALKARRPAQLESSIGQVGFAANRRPVKGGKNPGIGLNSAGLADHTLPLLRVRTPEGKLMGVVLNYACHCTTLTDKQKSCHGDWAGAAQAAIQSQNPGVIAMVCAGCGADANPRPRGDLEMAEAHGREVAAEVARLLTKPGEPIRGSIRAAARRIALPYAAVPTREELEQQIAAAELPKPPANARPLANRARLLLAQLRGEGKLPTALDYEISVWSLGNDLAMVFLPGEVTVGYALRLKQELPGRRLWINAYANDVPCYIVTRQVLDEGGYEPDSSMWYYARPSRFLPAIEDQIVQTVRELITKTDQR